MPSFYQGDLFRALMATREVDLQVIFARALESGSAIGARETQRFLERSSQSLDYLYIFGTVCFTVYGQLIVKWQVGKAGAFPTSAPEKFVYLFQLISNPWILSGIGSGFLAFLCWVGAMSKFQLSYAYPFMSLAFIMVMILSALFFHEPLTIPKVLGTSLVVLGIIIGSKK